ncbi:52 kDa repressor of the inhibitor of the protein kinase-like [Anthonomus grandis grandis]|uniref:52 kDa repressor of the inhibitor of the protein kinase-like n=1 Tax=Anthonomus grandis grandis TaxID=2921223 RepID=UPI0021654B65|nr:52 kDa repressor of the inhibitor of the protein kinase-like [Anthonomus grandis grandis]
MVSILPPTKRTFCKFCTLFPPNLSSVRGVLGSFIIRPFCKFKDVHEYCRKHANTHFHKTALEAAKSFLDNVPVDVQINKYSQESLEKIDYFLHCVLRIPRPSIKGGQAMVMEFWTLDKMRIDEGDTILKNHLEHGKKNASYRSVDIQNEIISISGDVIKAYCIKNVKISQAYSILADEIADISGKEQLSVGIRYFDEETSNIEEVFLGFAELTALEAKSIATAINEFLTKEDLDPDKCVGLGFDGCSTMSGKEGGVQAILRKKYKKALFFHCSSHKLNLVINDLNALPEIRNTVGAIKDIITFFRESVLRRKLIPNIPKLCETRWSEKYKSIRVFKENFCYIMEALETLSRDGNIATRKHAYQLQLPKFRLFLALD